MSRRRLGYRGSLETSQYRVALRAAQLRNDSGSVTDEWGLDSVRIPIVHER